MLSPTLASLLAAGLKNLTVECPACGTVFDVPISAIDLLPETPVAAIPRLRPMPCSECSTLGVRVVNIPESGEPPRDGD